MIFNINNFTDKTQIQAVPSTNSSLTYNGSSQSPTWLDYDSEQLSISGDTSAINAGTYTTYFTPKAHYEWTDGTTGAKPVTWTIAKANGSLSLSASSGTIRYVNGTAKFTVTRTGDGVISVKSSNIKIATVSISGTKVTIAPTGSGTTTITVSVAEGTNYKAPSNKTYEVTAQGYLIYDGVPCYDVVGVGKAPQSGYSSVSSVTTRQYDGYYYISTSDAGYGMAYLDTKVDLTNYSNLSISGTFAQDSTSYNSLSAWTSIGSYIANGRVSVVTLGSTGASKDISKLSSKVYIGLSLKEKAQKITTLRLT